MIQKGNQPTRSNENLKEGLRGEEGDIVEPGLITGWAKMLPGTPERHPYLFCRGGSCFTNTCVKEVNEVDV